MNRENERLLRDTLETAEETMARVGHAAYLLARIIAVVIEAISSLTQLKIHNSWNVSHLHPFYGALNYTKKQEEDLLKQIPKESTVVLLDRIAEKKLKEGHQGSAAVEDDDGTVAMSEGTMHAEDNVEMGKAVEEEESRNEVDSEDATPKVGMKRKDGAKGQRWGRGNRN